MLLRAMIILRIIGCCILLALSVLVWRTATDRLNALIFLAAMWVIFITGSFRFSAMLRRLNNRNR